jgi:hypothetical protein
MATIQQTNEILGLLRELVKGAGQGLFGNAIFFDEQPVTAKPNDISIDTTTSIVTQYNGVVWTQVLDLQNEIIVQNALTKTENTIELGGNLTKNTSIVGNNRTLNITNLLSLLLTSITTVNPGFPSLPYNITKSISLNEAGQIKLSVSEDVIPSNNIELSINQTEVTLQSTDSIVNRGFTYTNRPTVFNLNTLPDVQYLTEYVSNQNNIQVTVRTSLYTALPTDDVIITNSNVLLYSGANQTKLLKIKNSETGSITITPNGSETIEGHSSRTIGSNNSATLVYDKVSNWYIL